MLMEDKLIAYCSKLIEETQKYRYRISEQCAMFEKRGNEISLEYNLRKIARLEGTIATLRDIIEWATRQKIVNRNRRSEND